MHKNDHQIRDYDSVLDAKYGKIGTPERAKFDEAAYSFYTSQLLSDARKEAGVTQAEPSRTFPALSMASLFPAQVSCFRLLPLWDLSSYSKNGLLRLLCNNLFYLEVAHDTNQCFSKWLQTTLRGVIATSRMTNRTARWRVTKRTCKTFTCSTTSLSLSAGWTSTTPSYAKKSAKNTANTAHSMRDEQ